ncbi:MAG: beta-propeller fold lactonase family protein [Planctomycetota bacterium]
MKITSIVSLLVVVPILAACGGGSSGSSSNAVAGPNNLTYPEGQAVLVTGAAMVPLVPTVGGGQVSAWKIQPALPKGMQINGVNGTLSGTPSVVEAETIYTVTASNGGGSTQTQIVLRTARPSRWLYVANVGDDTVSSYALDGRTGEMSFHSFARDDAAQPGAEEAVLHPTLPFLFVPNLRDAAMPSNLSVFVADPSTGSLTPGVPVDIGRGIHTARVSVGGTELYVTASGDDALRTFHIDQGTGALTQLGDILNTSDGPRSMAVDPLGRFLFVGNRLAKTITVFQIDPVTGKPLGPGLENPLNGGNPNAILVDPTGRYLLVAEDNFGFLITFSIDDFSGALTTADVVPGLKNPSAIALDPSGEVVLLTSSSLNTLATFTLDPDSGDLAIGGAPVTTGAFPSGIAVDEAAFAAYVSCTGSDEMIAYDLADPLNPVETARLRCRQAPRRPAILHGSAPLRAQASSLYVANQGDQTLSQFRFDASDGSLTQIGPPVFAGDSPVGVAVDPLGRYVWVIVRGTNAVQTYSIDAASGALSPLGAPVAVGPEPAGISAGPRGQYVFLSSFGTDSVQSWRIDPIDGSFQFANSHAAGDGPGALMVDPTGQFLYVANELSANLSAFRIKNGAFVTELQGAPAPTAPKSIDHSADGSQILVSLHVDGGNDLVIAYNIHSSIGGLSLNAPGAFADEEPGGVAAHPRLDRAYVALGSGGVAGGVGVYSLDTLTGRPTFLETLATGLNPVDLLLDPTANFLFVVNQGGADVTVFAVDGAGDLSELGSAGVGLAPRAVDFLRRFE